MKLNNTDENKINSWSTDALVEESKKVWKQYTKTSYKQPERIAYLKELWYRIDQEVTRRARVMELRAIIEEASKELAAIS